MWGFLGALAVMAAAFVLGGMLWLFILLIIDKENEDEDKDQTKQEGEAGN